MWKIFFCTICSMLVTTNVFAFEIKQTGSLLHIETSAGLSNNYVSALCKDDRGTIWIATEDGLNRVEGSRILTYHKYVVATDNLNMAGLTDNALNDLLADSTNHRVWVATQRAGLCWFDTDSQDFGAFRHDPADTNSLITDDVTHIEQVSGSSLWLSTYHQGMELLDIATGRFTHFNASTVDGMPAAPIHSFAVKEDVIYIGHYDKGFTVMDSNTGRAVNYRHIASNERSLPADDVYCVTIDRHNRIWVGTSMGLALFLPESGEFIRCTSGCGIFSVLLIEDGRLLLGTEMGGVVAVDPLMSIRRPVTISGTSDDLQEKIYEGFEEMKMLSIRDIIEDDHGNIWIGSYGSGIFIHGKSLTGRFGSWSPSPMLPEEKILCLNFDSYGWLWTGTDGGGVNISGNSLLSSMVNKYLGCGVVLTSHCDMDGRMWIGTYTNGGAVYDIRNDSFYKIDTGNENCDVRCFCENGDEMWVGTSRGIYVVDRETCVLKRHYTVQTGLFDNLVRAIQFDFHGRLWVGTFSSGLAVYDHSMQMVTHYSASDSLHSNEINQILLDRKSHIWIATGEGLVQIDPSDMHIVECFDHRRGLTNDHIRAISRDSDDNIWFSTNVGVGCIEDNGTIRMFDHRDGLPSGNFSSASVACTADGLTCFGSTSGVVYFYPNQILVKSPPPQVRISRLQLLDYDAPKGTLSEQKTIFSCDKPISIDYGQNNFRIWFGVDNYMLADKVEYAYKLDSGEWITTDRDYISFIHLPPGSYRFQFRVRMHNQTWSENVESLQLTIRPPWYSAWYCRIVYVLLFAGIVVVSVWSYNRRISQKREFQYEQESMRIYRQVSDERLRFYMNITHELRTPLTLIMGPLEDLQHDESLPVSHREKVSIASRSARELLMLINELLEFRNTETGSRRLTICYDSLTQCIKETGQLFQESNMNPRTQVELRIEEGVFAYFDSFVVTTILNNLLSNAMKYTPQGTVTLFLRTISHNGEQMAEFGVSDTGYGMSEETMKHIFERYYRIKNIPHIKGTGIGLALVKNLVNLHEATIDVESQLHKGSTFRVRLHLNKTYPDALCREVPAPGLSDNRQEQSEQQSVHVAEGTVGTSVSMEGRADDSGGDNREIVLVVDDNAAIRHYITLSLGKIYRVITASDGTEGLELVRKQLPDVVIADIVMPGIDGIEMCRQIKRDIATCHIPVILLTAKDHLTDRTEVYAAGCDSYILKPFSSRLLESRIINLLDRRRQMAAQLVSVNLSTRNKAMNTLGSLDNEFLLRLNTLIDRELGSDRLNVAYLSDELCMDSSTLYRKIKGLTGISTNEYIRRKRMHKAAELIRSGRYKVSEVCWMVGINSENYFRQCFQEEFGISPSKYRDNNPTE